MIIPLYSRRYTWVILGVVACIMLTVNHMIMNRKIATQRMKSMLEENSVTKHIEDKTIVPPTTYNCKCKLKNVVKKKDVILNQYFQNISWLNETTVALLDKRHPNWPTRFFLEQLKNKSCSLIPTEFNIEWQNTYWQEVTLSNDTKLLLYSAFYDNRKLANEEPCVRLLGVSHSVELPNVWCHLWFDLQSPPVVSKVITTDHLDWQGKSKKRQNPYLMTCNISKEMENLTLHAVSLVAEPCSPASNILKVMGAKERIASAYTNETWAKDSRYLKGHIPAVCGTALYYYHEDFSLRIVEWLEMLRAMKFGKVYMHVTDIHPNIEKVMRYYEKEGFVSITSYSYPSPYFNDPITRRMWTLVERGKMWSQENIYFTDCLLRHMHQHRFITHFDPDELPVLPNHSSFPNFLEDVLERNSGKGGEPLASGYQLLWRYFHDDIKPSGKAAYLPEYLHILRHNRRSIKDVSPSPGKYKSIYDMDLVRGVFSHSVLRCITGSCKQGMKHIPLNYAYLGHFKNTCGSECYDVGRTVEESAIERYSKNVSIAVMKVLKELKLI